jgi:SAM-dependent methyltransferase
MLHGMARVGAATTGAHWEEVYRHTGVDSMSWFQREPTESVRLLEIAGVRPDSSVIDVGGGASVLVDRLLALRVRDVTVLDISPTALQVSRARLGTRAARVRWLEKDLVSWLPSRRYDIWHDRAVFHFLTNPSDRARYRERLRAALAPHGKVIIATFAADGPERCSGLLVARYGPDALAAEFPDLRVELVAREDHRTPAGGMQPFTWLLFSSADLDEPPMHA